MNYKSILIFIIFFGCTKEIHEPEFNYSVFSTATVSSILFESLQVEEVKIIFNRIVDGDTIVTERTSPLECSKIRMSGAALNYEYPSTQRLWVKIYFKFITQDGWVYMMNLSDESLKYIDVWLTLGIIDSEFRMSRVIDSKSIYSTDDVKEPILTWEIPEIR